MSAGIDRKRAVWMILFLSLMTPLGQMTGMMLDSASQQVQGFFMSVSAGTFIYIATAEIIVEEFSFATNKYKKFLLFCCGIVFIVLITMLE